MKRVKFHTKARQQLHEATLWYESQASGLGRRFERAVRDRVTGIQQNPTSGIIIDDLFSLKSVPRFPYWIVFVELVDAIWILAVHHERQDDEYWQVRISDVKPE